VGLIETWSHAGTADPSEPDRGFINSAPKHAEHSSSLQCGGRRRSRPRATGTTPKSYDNNPQTDVAKGFLPGRNVRSKCR
jgi:hypothetical protein